jgi:hypothetical protein
MNVLTTINIRGNPELISLFDLSNDELILRKMIKIDNLIFELITYNIDTTERIIILVKILNFNDMTQYYVQYYKSISELGFWRLLLYSEELGKFIKGDNYVLSTLVDIRLQIFLNNNYLKCTRYKNLSIIETERLNTLEYEKILTARKKFQIDSLESMFTQEEKDIILANKFNFKSSERIVRIVELDNINKYASCSTNISKSGLTLDQINSLLNKFASKYIINFETNKFISIHDDDIMIYNGIYCMISGNIYSVELVNKKDPNDVLILYYLHYNMSMGISLNGITFNQIELLKDYQISPTYTIQRGQYKFFSKLNKFASIGLFTKQNQITDFGLNSHIVPAGLLVCKILNYESLTSKHEMLSYRLYLAPDSNYHYIGTRYDEIYPFNTIKSNEVLMNELNISLSKCRFISDQNTPPSKGIESMYLITFAHNTLSLLWKTHWAYNSIPQSERNPKLYISYGASKRLIKDEFIFKPIFRGRLRCCKFISNYYRLYDLLQTIIYFDNILYDTNSKQEFKIQANIKKNDILQLIVSMFTDIRSNISEVIDMIDFDLTFLTFDSSDILKNPEYPISIHKSLLIMRRYVTSLFTSTQPTQFSDQKISRIKYLAKL